MMCSTRRPHILMKVVCTSVLACFEMVMPLHSASLCPFIADTSRCHTILAGKQTHNKTIYQTFPRGVQIHIGRSVVAGSEKAKAGRWESSREVFRSFAGQVR